MQRMRWGLYLKDERLLKNGPIDALKSYMKRFLIFSLLLTLVITSCKKEDVNDSFAAELRTSPTTLELGGNNVVLRSDLWRDFMPIAEPGGSDLRAVTSLVDIFDIPISSDIILTNHHVIYGEEVWTAVPDTVDFTEPEILAGSVSGGPKWGPDVMVDVVLELEYLGDTYRILAEDEEIIKTE